MDDFIASNGSHFQNLFIFTAAHVTYHAVAFPHVINQSVDYIY